jgi:putative membrane protein
MMKLEQIGTALISSGAMALLGVAVFALTFWLIVKVTPFSIRKEIEEDHNTALAILVSSVILGIALIVSAAVSG